MTEAQAQPECSLSILLAEDDPAIQMLALRMLKKLGHHVDLANNGSEVLSALEASTYDLILMDIQMPEMDGIEATRIIRKRWQQVPKIIFVTACVSYKDACLSVGGDDFLAKPVKIEDLHAAITRNAIMQPI
jgi:CheY-like chemotaxis protein